MEKYRNVPMDFADATLAVLAEELETEWVFTLDRPLTVLEALADPQGALTRALRDMIGG